MNMNINSMGTMGTRNYNFRTTALFIGFKNYSRDLRMSGHPSHD